MALPIFQPEHGVAEARPGFSNRYATVDHWHANLSESLIHFGPHAKRIHSLDETREKFGLGEVIRNYDDADKPEILGLLESISPAHPDFEFSSVLKAGERVAEVRWVAHLMPTRSASTASSSSPTSFPPPAEPRPRRDFSLPRPAECYIRREPTG